MKYTTTKNFYTRFVLLPVLAVTAFLIYCAQHDGVSAREMAKNIDNSMMTAIYVEKEPQDILAFVPETKPMQTMEVASK